MSRHATFLSRHAVLVIAGWLAVGASAARAGSEKPSGILIFPRVEVDTAQGVDTLVQISNHGMGSVGVFCFYVSALGFCGGSGGAICRTDADCAGGLHCIEQCHQRDFVFNLTRGQTLGFAASQGVIPPVLDIPPGSIPATQTDPYLGELKCVQVDPTTAAPVAGNDLIGTATILHSNGPDAAGYNAVSIESTGRNNGDGTLCLGSNATGACQAAEYVRCPGEMDLDHFFEGAMVAGARIENELTLVPCSQRLNEPPHPLVNQVELLVINEFEERRCGTFSVSCVGDIHFADYPLFSIGVQGTLAGHTRLRAPVTSEDNVGHALIGVALERHVGTGGTAHSAAHQLTTDIVAEQADFIHLPLLPPMPLQRATRAGGGGAKVAVPTTLSRRRAP